MRVHGVCQWLQQYKSGKIIKLVTQNTTFLFLFQTLQINRNLFLEIQILKYAVLCGRLFQAEKSKTFEYRTNRSEVMTI